MAVFYEPEITFPYTTLSPDESRHCSKVLRLKEEDQITILDGQGSCYQAKITESHPKATKAEILDTRHIKKPDQLYIHLALAPTKNIDRTEWFVEKAVELGVDEISFILCDRSERKKIRMDRIERIAVSAMKQSFKWWLPVLNPLQSFHEFLNNFSPEQEQGYIARQDATQHLKDVTQSPANYRMIIGPEGDFNKKELQQAQERQFEAVHLGPHRLRTETAGIAACHILNMNSCY